MTADEAIRINKENEVLQREDGFEQSAKATQLGIEALERLWHFRAQHYLAATREDLVSIYGSRLESETEAVKE